MSADETSKLDRILEHLDSQTEEIAKINRGLYGDPANEIKGALKRLSEVETEVSTLKEFKKKIVYFVGAVTTAATLAFELVGDWFKRQVGL